jgi:predicted N-acetyltransferase YhbS
MQIDRAKHSQCNQQQPLSALVQDKPSFGAIVAARIRHSSLVTYSEDANLEFAQRPQRDDLVVREATLDDLQCILELYAQLFSNTDQASENRRELLSAHYEAFSEIKRSPDSYVFVAESAGAVVGTIAMSMIPNLSHCGRPWAVIENVVVDERARKSSIGASLMQHAIGLAPARGCFRVILSSSVHREGSHKFYQRLGLEAFGYSFNIHFPPGGKT